MGQNSLVVVASFVLESVQKMMHNCRNFPAFWMKTPRNLIIWKELCWKLGSVAPVDSRVPRTHQSVPNEAAMKRH